MEHKMLWGALGIGVAGWICLLLLSLLRRGETVSSAQSPMKQARSFEWLAGLLPILVWLATLPAKAPFSSGQGYGRGFLLGGVVAFAGVLVLFRLAKRYPDSARLAATTSVFGALIVACVPLLWMRHAVIEALMGAALGWVAVSVVWLCAARQNDESSRGEVVALLNGAGFATALCAASALGIYRDFQFADVARGTHSAVALVLAAGVGLALLFDVLLREIASSGRTEASVRLLQVVATFACVALPLGIAFVEATRVLDDMKVFLCVGTGCILGLLGWALGWNHARQRETPTISVAPVATLVALCGFMFAYGLQQGFGVGLMLLAAWPLTVLLLSPGETEEGAPLRFDVAQTAALLGTFLAILLVSRVFATRFRADLRGATLSDQFALFGFLAGATVPALLSSLLAGSDQARASMPRLAGAGVLALLLLAAMLAIWGVKVVPAFFAGTALAGVMLPSSRFGAGIGSLFSLSMALVLTQWTSRFLPLADAPRAAKMQFLLWGFGGALVLVILVDVGLRLSQRAARGREVSL